MKAVLASFAAIIIIGNAAHYGFERAGFLSEEVYSSESVRLNYRLHLAL